MHMENKIINGRSARQHTIQQQLTKRCTVSAVHVALFAVGGCVAMALRPPKTPALPKPPLVAALLRSAATAPRAVRHSLLS
jgi:hypothetical protein